MADDVVLLNLEEGIGRVMNNKNLYVKLLVKFKDGTNLNDLETALAEGDMEKAHSTAHMIKGVVANLSLPELCRQIQEIEAQIKANDVKPDQLNVLKNVFSQTIKEVEKVIAQNG
ncbi:MAG: Hpt domain-containing protein [Treponema sp.]|nr:Hpt domain-containing protein [Treponema sp.]